MPMRCSSSARNMCPMKSKGSTARRNCEQGAAAGSEQEKAAIERHLSGQELCEAIRRYAIDQFGLMAKCVLNNWGLHETGDIGEIVFNLIGIEQMRKTVHDRREDFDHVFDFQTARPGRRVRPRRAAGGEPLGGRTPPGSWTWPPDPAWATRSWPHRRRAPTWTRWAPTPGSFPHRVPGPQPSR